MSHLSIDDLDPHSLKDCCLGAFCICLGASIDIGDGEHRGVVARGQNTVNDARAGVNCRIGAAEGFAAFRVEEAKTTGGGVGCPSLGDQWQDYASRIARRVGDDGSWRDTHKGDSCRTPRRQNAWTCGESKRPLRGHLVGSGRNRGDKGQKRGGKNARGPSDKRH